MLAGGLTDTTWVELFASRELIEIPISKINDIQEQKEVVEQPTNNLSTADVRNAVARKENIQSCQL